MVPDPSRNVLSCRVLEAFNLIQAMMVESFPQWAERRLDIGEVDNKSRARIDRSFDSNFNPIGVAMHAVAPVFPGNVWQPVRSFESEGLRDFHRIPTTLWV